MLRWGGETYAHLMQLYYGPHAKAAGVALMTGHWLQEAPESEPFWWAVLSCAVV